MVDVNIINAFLASAKDIMAMIAGLSLDVGSPRIRDLSFTDEYLRIMLGITGELQGQVIICLSKDKAKETASKMMMGMPVAELDDMALSALSELGNMIMGNTSTALASQGLSTDITPPIIEQGASKLNSAFTNICVPFTENGQLYMELNIVVKVK